MQSIEMRQRLVLELDEGELDLAPEASGTCRLYRLHARFCVAVTTQTTHAPLRLHVRGDGLVTIRVVLAGRARFRGDGFSPLETSGAHVTVFHHRPEQEVLHEVGTGEHRVVTLVACPDELRRKFGWSFDASDAAPTRLALTPPVEKAARDLLHNPYRGARHAAFVEARALELLCAVATAADEAEASETLRLSTRDCERIHRVRDSLMDVAHQPPSIAQLARQAGMSKTKLMRAFKQIHGETIADFCRRLRLEEARAMLLARRLTIGEIAAAVGYQHQSSFTAAFSAHFGFTPRTLRRAPPLRAAGVATRRLN